MKSIGVVVPIYNTKKYLVQCIESILNQNYEELQIVLVDDGSDDGSEKICDEFAKRDSRVRVIHQVNKGKLESRYIGAFNLRTDYVTFVDSDDWIADDTYSIFSEYMEQGIDIISYKIIRYKNANYQIESFERIKQGTFWNDKYRDVVCSAMIWDEEINSPGIDPSLCNKLFKREIIMPQLDKARKICIDYGDDSAVTYPTLYSANSYAIVNAYKYYHRGRADGQVAYYFLDDNYYNKLIQLYEYLKERFNGDANYVRQLDMFFAYSAQLRLRKYEIVSSKAIYLAPFNRIPKGSRIVLYGAGSVGQSYYKQITELDYCQVVAWMDKNKTCCGSKKLSRYMDFTSVDYDYVVIALKSESAVKKIIQEMCDNYGVIADKIIWEFHEL